jgi:DNA-binding transcriptional ArsR family regulator
MKECPDIAELAALLGDPARANIVSALMAGMALTAGELAREAGVSPQTASGHLTRLREAGLLVMETQGRARYYRIAGPEVAEAIESLTVLAARLGRLRTRPGPRDAALREARFCYDHLAGDLGVAIHDGLIAGARLQAAPDGLALTPRGRAFFVAEGVDLAALEAQRRPLCRACLDWSARRHHLAGALGAHIARMVVARGWARREKGRREARFSPAGRIAFQDFLARARADETGLARSAGANGEAPRRS